MRRANRLTVTAFTESIGKDYANLEYCMDSEKCGIWLEFLLWARCKVWDIYNFA